MNDQSDVSLLVQNEFTDQQLHAEDILITLQRTMLMSPCLHTPQKTNKSVSKMIQYVQCGNLFLQQSEDFKASLCIQYMYMRITKSYINFTKFALYNKTILRKHV